MSTLAAERAKQEIAADDAQKQIVIVLDFGAQYSQLIARRIRECQVYCELLPWDTPIGKIMAKNPKGLVLSGGPASVYDPGAPSLPREIFDTGIPILGICYGMQLMAYELGGRVEPGDNREYGRTKLDVTSENVLFEGLNPSLMCWMSHGDHVLEAPPGFQTLARTTGSPVAAMGDTKKKHYGVQFHPEVAHTPWGIELIRNFVYKECGCEPIWTMESFLTTSTAQVRAQVGAGKVVCGLSGGVDSAAVAALVHRAVGSQLTCIFVNHGFLRKGEPEQVLQTFQNHFKANLVYVDASERFLARLKGVTDPELKRRIIGEEFVRVFEDESRKIGDVSFLAQGTLYPDVIESGTKSAARIKTHHNVGGLPEDMNFQLVEPLRNLFKDEVRALGAGLGLPQEMIWRQPFPGPGLAIRVIGEITRERLEILRNADAIAIEELKRAGQYRNIWQAFAVLTPVRSVGVMGDKRTYGETVVLRAVTSEDGMTADWARIPYEVLERISNRLSNEVSGVTRVVYDISSKPPATIEWE